MNKLLSFSIALLLVSLSLTSCSSLSNGTTTSPAEITDKTVNVSESVYSPQEAVSENIYFYGEYVIDGEIPDTGHVYDRIIFFPDGKCYAHNYFKGEDQIYYSSYEYSYCTQSNYIGFSRENGSFEGMPSMSEHRTLLKFDNYVLKLVE